MRELLGLISATMQMDSSDMMLAIKQNASSRGISSLYLSSISLASPLLASMISSSSSAPSIPTEDKPVDWRVSLASFSLEGYAPGYKSSNQDSFIALPSFGGNPGSILLGVFDDMDMDAQGIT